MHEFTCAWGIGFEHVTLCSFWVKIKPGMNQRMQQDGRLQEPNTNTMPQIMGQIMTNPDVVFV
jgi:hypothetical protein